MNLMHFNAVFIIIINIYVAFDALLLRFADIVKANVVIIAYSLVVVYVRLLYKSK